MTYSVTITSSSGSKATYACGGSTEQAALIYAGKVVEAHADRSDPKASVAIYHDGAKIGIAATVAEMTTRAV